MNFIWLYGYHITDKQLIFANFSSILRTLEWVSWHLAGYTMPNCINNLSLCSCWNSTSAQLRPICRGFDSACVRRNAYLLGLACIFNYRTATEKLKYLAHRIRIVQYSIVWFFHHIFWIFPGHSWTDNLKISMQLLLTVCREAYSNFVNIREAYKH